jgi:uncharacterized protein (TIGR02118 family)
VFSHFVTFIDPDPRAQLSAPDRAAVTHLIRRIPGLARAHLLSPAIARDPYFDDGPAPLLTLQLYFERLETLEEAAGPHGALQALVAAIPPGLAPARVFQQVTWTRFFPVSEPIGTPPDPRHSCSFLVHYPGAPDSLNEWLSYYMSHHVPLICRFPGVRAVEVHTRVDWVDALPWRREQHFQRNKIVFDSAAALERALHSPVREQMKADRASFPPFSGGNVHHPLATETIVGVPW